MPEVLTDAERARRLRRMKAVATGVLVGLTVLFAVAFILQRDYPAWAYVRAAAEGGMVGAIADWFAVTAIFRHPLGVPIPHTAIIPRKKDQLGESLGSFFETNFLQSEVMAEKLTAIKPAGRIGAWLTQPENAETVAAESANLIINALNATDDDVVRGLLADLMAEHMVTPEWSPTLGQVLSEVVEAGHHQQGVDVVAERVYEWVRPNQHFFVDAVTSRSPGWVPQVVDRLLGERIHRELLGYLSDVQVNPRHELRVQVTDWLSGLADDMVNDPATRTKVEDLKHQVFADPQVATLANQIWTTAKAALLDQLADPSSELHQALVRAIADFGERLTTDRALAAKLDTWAVTAAQNVAERYGPELVEVISETIHRWDGAQAAQTIELYAGRDLQFIRINGSIIGALAGLVIYSLATWLL